MRFQFFLGLFQVLKWFTYFFFLVSAILWTLLFKKLSHSIIKSQVFTLIRWTYCHLKADNFEKQMSAQVEVCDLCFDRFVQNCYVSTISTQARYISTDSIQAVYVSTMFDRGRTFRTNSTEFFRPFGEVFSAHNIVFRRI